MTLGADRGTLDCRFLGRIASSTSGMIQLIFPSMISSRATSAAPMFAVSATNGRLIDPPTALSWRTRRETMLTRTFGLPTISRAFFTNSAFISYCLEKYKNGSNNSEEMSALKRTACRHAARLPTIYFKGFFGITPCEA
jgi:hypothetical protein